MFSALRQMLADENGSVTVEYALLLAVLGVGMAAGALGCLEWVGKTMKGFQEGVGGDMGSGEAEVVGVVGR